MTGWSDFFLGELGAAAALAGLLFVAVSVNQARILQLGRMADRGIEGLVMLFLVLVVASLSLVPGQPIRFFGAEVFLVGTGTLAALVPLQRGYVRAADPAYRGRTTRMVWVNRAALAVIAVAGLLVLLSGDGAGIYLLAAGILLTFVVVGASAWVLLIEINR